MGCIDQGDARVRSGGAGDAKASSSRRDAARASPWSTQEGRVFKGLGRRLAPLAMRKASRRNAILAQDLENAVQPVSNSQTGS